MPLGASKIGAGEADDAAAPLGRRAPPLRAAPAPLLVLRDFVVHSALLREGPPPSTVPRRRLPSPAVQQPANKESTPILPRDRTSVQIWWRWVSLTSPRPTRPGPQGARPPGRTGSRCIPPTRVQIALGRPGGRAAAAENQRTVRRVPPIVGRLALLALVALGGSLHRARRRRHEPHRRRGVGDRDGLPRPAAGRPLRAVGPRRPPLVRRRSLARGRRLLLALPARPHGGGRRARPPRSRGLSPGARRGRGGHGPLPRHRAARRRVVPGQGGTGLLRRRQHDVRR